MAEQRLDKLLASTGRWSRREARALIREGRVLLNGEIAGSGDDRADPEAASIAVDGTPLNWRAHTYVLLHKPAGVLTATEDRRQRTVLDLLPPELRRLGLSPVGRLDRDTTGLLLLTDDGALAHRLLSPRRHVDKTYLAVLDRPLGPEDVRAFAEGMVLRDGTRCMPAELELSGGGTEARITLREGKFHQVKRMAAARGAAVLSLKRLSMGPLTLDNALKEGEFRFLTEGEIERLKAAAEERVNKTTKNQ